MGNTQLTPQSPTPPSVPTPGQTTPPPSLEPVQADGGPLGLAALASLKGASSAIAANSDAEDAEKMGLTFTHATPESSDVEDAKKMGLTFTPSSSPSISPEDKQMAQEVMEKGISGLVPGGEIGEGVVKGALKTADTVARFFHPGAKGELETELTTPTDASQKAGSFGEAVMEFVAGDEALQGLSAAKKLGVAAKITKFAETSPKLAKALELGLDAVRTGTVGAAQGAVKSEPGQTESGAVRGAIGGATGSVLADVTMPALNSILKNFGQMGGLDASGTLVRAARPSIKESDAFVSGLDKVLPRLVDANQATPVRTLGAFEDLVHNTANDLWTDEVMPQITRHANEPIDLSPVAAQVRTAATRNMQEYFPQEAEAVENFAKLFDKTTTVEKANEDIIAFNAKLQKYYKAAPEAKAAILKTDGEVAGLEAATDGLRDTLYSHLETAGEDVPAQLRQEYGALKTIERVFGKRAAVADRQAPINLPQAIGALGAVASGNPLVAAVPMLTKLANSSDFLLRRGLAKAAEETGAAPTGFVNNLIRVTKAGGSAATPAVASQVGQAAAASAPGPKESSENIPPLPPGHVHIKTSDGSEFFIPAEHLTAAQGIDEGLQLLHGVSA